MSLSAVMPCVMSSHVPSGLTRARAQPTRSPGSRAMTCSGSGDRRGLLIGHFLDGRDGLHRREVELDEVEHVIRDQHVTWRGLTVPVAGREHPDLLVLPAADVVDDER